MQRRTRSLVLIVCVLAGAMTWQAGKIWMPVTGHADVRPGAADRGGIGVETSAPTPVRRLGPAIPGSALASEMSSTLPEDACITDRRARVAHAIATSAPAATVEEALGHALLQSLLDDPRATSAAFTASARRWPRDARVAWLALDFCRKDHQCDGAPWIRHLLSVDGDNAYAWLAALDSAFDRHDDGGVAIALRRAGDAPRYAPPNGFIFRFARPRIRELGVPPSCATARDSLTEQLGHEPTEDDWADIGAHGMEMAAIGIGYSIIRVCDSSRRLHAARKRDCIRILERLGHDETLATRHSAIRSLIRLLDPNASAPWREEYRKLSWLHGVAGSQLGFPSGTAGRMWSDGEVATWQALAREQGLWPPPDDWLPDAPVTRRLILEGR